MKRSAGWLGRRRRRGRRGDRGQSLVELAIVLPLALLLLTASIDVGRIIFTYIALEDAVQEGSIYYAHNPTASDTTVRDRVRGSSNAPEVANATVTKSPTCTDANQTMWVQASAPAMTMLTPAGSQIFGNIVLTSRITASNLKGACT